jgi:hypothetical protein
MTGSSSEERFVFSRRSGNSTDEYQLLSLLSMSFAYTAIAYGWGKPMAYVSPSNIKSALKMQFGMQFAWLFSLCLVRLSVAASLLRFDCSIWWKWMLYFIMGLQCFITASYVVIQLGQCTPISASWETVPDVKCWPTTPIVVYGWAVSGMFDATYVPVLMLTVARDLYLDGHRLLASADQTYPRSLAVARRKNPNRIPHVPWTARHSHSLRENVHILKFRCRRRSASDHSPFYVRNIGEHRRHNCVLASGPEVAC